MSDTPFAPTGNLRPLLSLLMAPAFVVFLSSNFVNVGNLAFNMIFSRLMDPETFGILALLLTIKLALLGILGALQMAVSQMIASATGREEPANEQALSRINRLLFAGLYSLGISLTVGFVLAGTFGARPELPANHLLLMLLAAVPFGASLSILRGIAFGRMQSGRIVVSGNIEMLVRLVGAYLAWELGYGLEGVVFAIGFSIFAGWVVLADLLPKVRKKIPVGSTANALLITAAPFGLLQLSQVLALDGDIFLAKATLPAHEAGYIGVLSLFQRIQFFACFALAGILLPSVIIAVREGKSMLRAVVPVFALFSAVSVPFALLASLAPETLVGLMVGDQYLSVAPVLKLAVASAVFFTFNFLVATQLLAMGSVIGVVIVLVSAILQMILMTLSDPTTFADLHTLKAMCQATTSVFMSLAVCQHVRRRHLSQSTPFRAAD